MLSVSTMLTAMFLYNIYYVVKPYLLHRYCLYPLLFVAAGLCLLAVLTSGVSLAADDTISVYNAPRSTGPLNTTNLPLDGSVRVTGTHTLEVTVSRELFISTSAVTHTTVMAAAAVAAVAWLLGGIYYGAVVYGRPMLRDLVAIEEVLWRDAPDMRGKRIPAAQH